MVLLVRAQMLGELVDSRGEQGDLDLGGSGVGIGTPVLGDDLLLLLSGKAHVRRKTVATWRPPASVIRAAVRCGPTARRLNRPREVLDRRRRQLSPLVRLEPDRLPPVLE